MISGLGDLNFVAVIPARMGSSRFPGKPLAQIAGKSMIQRVWENVESSRLVSSTFVATCDYEISSHVNEFGGQSVMTSKSHERASDRCAEALPKIEEMLGKKIDVLVMIQGDEPLIDGSMIDEVCVPFIDDRSLQVANLATKISNFEEFNNPNTIKVVMDDAGDALYFSRSPIPYVNSSEFPSNVLKQVCAIPFRRDFLLRYTQLAPTRLEILESIDMLRILESRAAKVRMIDVAGVFHAVDHESDIGIVESILKRCD